MQYFQAREALQLCPPEKSKRRPRKRGSFSHRQGGVFVDYVQTLLTRRSKTQYSHAAKGVKVLERPGMRSENGMRKK